MSVSLQRSWTKDEFFAWAARQDGLYEFDGHRPLEVTGGSIRHGLIARGLVRALETRLDGSAAQVLGPDVGIETTGNAIRYPDALVTFDPLLDETTPTVRSAVIVFEVLSPTSGQNDRVDKVREYAAVSSIRRYVILEFASVGLTVLSRSAGKLAWQVTTLTVDDGLALPELGLEIPVAEIYRRVGFNRRR